MRKRVLITGGAKGLGKEIALVFAENGYDILITYLNSEEKAIELKEEILSKYNVNVEIFKVDIRKEEDIKELFKSIKELNVLINNAAYNDDKDFLDKSQEDFLNILNINLVGPFLICKYAFPLLKKTQGNIVNIASTNGIDTMYQSSMDYDASKAGLINMTKNLSFRLSPVRVNAIAPGWINTEVLKDMDVNMRKKEEAYITMGRFAYPKEIAEIVYFVASDKASYMTGSIIRVDGGNKYGN